MSVTARTRKLREMMVTTPAICVERALYMTESYKESESDPNEIRRAKALDNILRKMTVSIYEGELIVGCFTSKVRGGAILPEVRGQWVLDEIDTLSTRGWDKYQPLTEEEIVILQEIMPYWKGKSLYEKWRAMMPEQQQQRNYKIIGTAGFCENAHHLAHAVVDYSKLLAVGSYGIIEEADEILRNLDCSKAEDLEKYQFMRSVKIAHGGVIAFAARYAELAQSMAKDESNSQRKMELENIAAICRWVPANPARNFREALQSMWFMYVALMIEGWGAGMSLGRCDQYLYPFYKKDIDAGLITNNEVQELLAMILIKMNGAIALQSLVVSDGKGGHPVMQGLTLGGITMDGRDAVNELSYLFLEAEKEIGLCSEDLVVRINKCNPDSYVLKAVEVAKALGGKIKFVSDETSIQSMISFGVPIDRARDYVSTGCHNPTIPAFSRNSGGGVVNHPLLLELALNNGYSRLTGEKLGPQTGDPRKFKTFEEIIVAYRKQVVSALDLSITYKHADLKLFSQVPCVLCSSLYEGCMEKGKDIYNGGTAPYLTNGISITGAANVGDSLAAIKKVIFEDKQFTIEQLIDALDKNFAGEEELLHRLTKAPKFGNDDDYVDLLLKEQIRFTSDYSSTLRTFAGSKGGTSCIAMTLNVVFGRIVGALPDGRKAGLPLAEGGISPYQGRNTSGASATMNSVAKLDQVKITNGSILNMRISSDSVSDAAKLKKFAALLRTFCETGGNLIQFNFTSNAILRAAQKNPEQYKDLLVRVATYSAFFVELGPELQNDIINRVEFDAV